MKKLFRKIAAEWFRYLLYGIGVLLLQNNAVSQEYHGGVSPPGFKGGKTVLKQFIYKSLVIPDSVKEKGISGTVMVSLEINKEGKADKVKLVRGINPFYDSEALRVASLLTDWQPALNWGKPVTCRILLPIDFECEKPVSQKFFIISGSVLDKATGQPMEGTLVIIKGTSSGTVTDSNGQYKIEVPGEENELEFSAMGYELKIEPVGKNRTLNVELNQGYYLINFKSEN
ncbi:MAG TPA: TonB family protein [Bacteroidales bacterium]|nr:TonB family protein [Bacteroidales bacterium]